MNKAYEFIAHPDERPFDTMPKSSVTYTIHDNDISLDDMLEQFEYFLKAAGYYIGVDQSLQLVDDEEEEKDEDFSEYRFDNSFDMDVLDRSIEESFKGWNAAEEPAPIDPEISINYQDVTRVEVIDDEGRVYVNTDVELVVTDLQDEGRTLKVFIR
tara:strand:- start:56 stop:523 length:468 start_codon:yes stop_codon:yes gene_type:complete